MTEDKSKTDLFSQLQFYFNRLIGYCGDLAQTEQTECQRAWLRSSKWLDSFTAAVCCRLRVTWVSKKKDLKWPPCTSIKWKMPVMMDDRRWRSEITEFKSKQFNFHVQSNLPTLPQRSTSRPCCGLEHLLLLRHCSTLHCTCTLTPNIMLCPLSPCLRLFIAFIQTLRFWRGFPTMYLYYADCLAFCLSKNHFSMFYNQSHIYWINTHLD